MTVTILDFSCSCVEIIHLTDEECKEAEKHEDFYDFLCSIESKYGLNLSNSQWMVTEDVEVYTYKDGKEVLTYG